jgi:hypothetical protein
MARTRAFALFVAVVLTLTGCSAFFDFNAFSSLDKAAVPNPSRYQGTSGLANLQADLSSPSVVAALKSSPSTVATILSDLNTTYLSGPLTTPDQQTAAILYSDLALKSTSGDILVNNIVATVMTQTTASTLQSVLASIVPADVAADPTKFAAMVNGLLAANVAYDKLGQSLATLPKPPGMNMGDTAQKAAVAWLMYCVDQGVIGAGYTSSTSPSDVDEMFLLVNNQPNSIGTLSTIPANPFGPMSSAGLNPPSLQRIFDAAGAPYPK